MSESPAAEDTLRNDLKRLRDESFELLLDSDNQLAMHIVPLSDVAMESLPKGFSLALSARLNRGIPAEPNAERDLQNLRRHFQLVPVYSMTTKTTSGKRGRDRKLIWNNLQTDSARKYRERGFGIFLPDLKYLNCYTVSLLSDGTQPDFGVVLWTYSLLGHFDEQGVEVSGLTTAEKHYLRFMSKVGNLLQFHGRYTGKDSSIAWVSFLVEYVWTQKRPKVSRGFATVDEIGLVTGHAIEHFLKSDSPKTGESKKTNIEHLEKLCDMLPKNGQGVALLRHLWPKAGKDIPFEEILTINGAFRKTPNDAHEGIKKVWSRISKALGASARIDIHISARAKTVRLEVFS